MQLQRRKKYDVTRFKEVIHLYKYMRIYLWSALRTKDLIMRVLRMMDLIADLLGGEKINVPYLFLNSIKKFFAILY